MKKDPFRTSIVCTPAPDAERLGVHSGVLFMGSCFAGNVGQRMEEACFKVLVNPHGVLFNPFSVAAALEAFLENRQVALGDLVERDGLWHSFQHHGSFSGPDAAKVVQAINAATLKGHSFLKEAHCLVVTFGTAWVYALGEAHQVVANCHKFPARDFQRYRLSVRAVVERWQRLLVALRQENPDLQVIFTVSPVRHWKDGAHGNQLSKAVLLLAVEELLEQHAGNAYFPAYELMMDELRDYRFYADDMLHPSAQAVDYIWDRFSGAWLNEEALAFYREVQQLLTELRHRPLHPGALSFESFRKKTAKKIADLVKRYPNLDFSSLEALVRQ
ncbi:GSCFA domain-containing protein [Geofilum rhodophaeum]|uniref:GSCFA domain-containing protein n=1 Tax=Geofilum rhodophaeum TaxID=1965019 RepID=UPI000B5281A5|nr:GSCFA domain-containing protein [Geofilum rhodophaeum]